MTLIRVQPDSIRQYASVAQQNFDAIRVELQALVSNAAGVQYFGPNAVDFKTRCGQMAADFATSIGSDLAQIADAVRASTTNIAGSLGGAAIAISVNSAPVPIPAIAAGDGSVEIDTAGLEGLKPTVSRHIEAISSQLDAHLRSLSSTDWQGSAKEGALSAVTGFTNAAKSKAAEAQASITSYVDSQIASVLASDR
jgi:hypothetical protein